MGGCSNKKPLLIKPLNKPESLKIISNQPNSLNKPTITKSSQSQANLTNQNTNNKTSQNLNQDKKNLRNNAIPPIRHITKMDGRDLTPPHDGAIDAPQRGLSGEPSRGGVKSRGGLRSKRFSRRAVIIQTLGQPQKIANVVQCLSPPLLHAIVNFPTLT